MKRILSRTDIAASLMLEKIDVDLYRSQNLQKPHSQARAVFGGQIIGQALVAAHRTVDRDELSVHSLHAYFLLGGDPDTPAVYHVDRIRDGRSFSTRSVLVKQNGKAIFSAQVSFHKPEESPLDHFRPMPTNIPPPEECLTLEEHLENRLKKAEENNDEKVARRCRTALENVNTSRPIETRYPNPEDALVFSPLGRNREAQEPASGAWIRCKTKLPDRQWMHCCVGAYASDYGMIPAGAKALGYPNTTYSMLASLDHAMWFHSPFRADDWLWYEVDCPRAKSSRATIFGRLYKPNGELVVTVAQEAVMRLAKPSKL